MFRSRISVFKHLVLLSEFTVNLLQSRKCIGGSSIRESHLVMVSDTFIIIQLNSSFLLIMTSVLTYLFVAKFMFAVLRIAKVDFRRFIFRIVSELNGYLQGPLTLVYFLMIFHSMTYISGFKATSEVIISDDSFYVTFRRVLQLNMIVNKSAIWFMSLEHSWRPSRYS